MIIFLIFLSFQIKENSQSQIFIKYKPERIKIEKIDGYKYISFRDASCDSTSGMPMLPYRIVNVFYPTDGDAHITASYNEIEVIKGMPLPVSDVYGKKMKGLNYYKYSPPIVTSRKFSFFGTKYVQIFIFPFTFTGKNIEYRKGISIKIKFTGKNWGWIPDNIKTKELNYLNPEWVKKKVKAKSTGGKSFNPNWLKIKIVKSGIYKITYDDLRLAGVIPEEIEPYSIALYNGGSHTLSWNNDSVENIPDSIPYRVGTDFSGNNNSVFEQGEYLLFYGTGLSGFSKNNSNGLNLYYNPFTDTNVYWLTWGKEALQMENETAESGVSKNSFQDTIHLEQDSLCPAGSGLGWVWEYMSAAEQDTVLKIPIQIPDAVNDTGEVRLAIYFPTYKQHHIRLQTAQDSADFIFTHNSDVTPIVLDTMLNLSGGKLTVKLLGGDTCFFDWAEVVYNRQLSLNSGDIRFTVAPNDTTNISLVCKDITPEVYDISNPFVPKKINKSVENDSLKFSVNGPAAVYIAKSILKPVSIEYVSPYNLREGGSNYLIITHPLLKKYADMLGEWRSLHLKGYTNPVTDVITVDDIYNNFSFGVKDPVAIKRFIYYASVNYNPSPSFILLFGRGTYDSKNHFGYEPPTDLIPLHSEGANVNFYGLLNTNYNWDDWYVDFGGDNKPDIPIGRINVDNANDARDVVDKIEKWEQSSGLWRIKSILVADDENHAGWHTELSHTTRMEIVSSTLPEWMIKNKVYLIFSAYTGHDKPDMREKLIKLLNEGALFTIFYGHGNSMQLADENVLRNPDLANINNLYKMPFFYFGTCNAGYYDRPDYRCMADEMVTNHNGGNIASLAATRGTYSSQNYNLGSSLAQRLFQYNTIGELITAAKNATSYSPTYTFFGDPGLPFSLDTTNISVSSDDSIIGGKIFSLNGAYSKDTISGEFLIREKDRDTTYSSYSNAPIDVKLPPSYSIYTGDIYTSGDSFEFNFIPPYNIASDTTYIYGYIHHHSDANIFFKPLLSGKDDSTSIQDSLTFKFLINGTELKDGDPVKESGKMQIEVCSKTGIDLRNPKYITAYINDPYHQSGIGMADKFRYYTNSYRKGTVSFDYLLQPEDDSLIIEVQAKTNSGKWGMSGIHLFVKRRGKFIESVYNYPNPFSGNTTFIISLDDDGDAKLSIFTSTGRLIKKFDFYGHYGLNYIRWNGRDESNNTIPPGLYIYKLIFTSNTFYNTESKFGKMVHIPE